MAYEMSVDVTLCQNKTPRDTDSEAYRFFEESGRRYIERKLHLYVRPSTNDDVLVLRDKKTHRGILVLSVGTDGEYWIEARSLDGTRIVIGVK